MSLTKARPAKKIFRAGIVGCGRIASSFDLDPRRKYVATHAGAYSNSPSVKLISACDIDEQKLEEFSSRWKVKKLYQDLDEMLSKEDLDILSICTWPSTHYGLAKTAVEHGVKALFCEKPITDDLSKADELVDLCERRGVLLVVNHSRRWDPGHQRIKKFLESGRLGRILQVQCYYTAGLANTGTHLFDLLRLFLGEADWVRANPAPSFGEKDLTLSGQIFFKNGALTTVSGLDVGNYLIFEIDFYGTKGRFRVKDSGFGLEYWKIGPSPYFPGYQELVPASLPIDLKEKNMMTHAVSDLVSCLRRGGRPLSNGNDGRQSLEIICAFYESFRSGSRIELPLKNRNITIP